MMGRCKFRNDWLLKKDKLGHQISSWASKCSETEALCKVCSTKIDFSNKGFHSFIQHADSDKHKKYFNSASNQMYLVDVSRQISLYSSKNAATVSELIWAMKSVCCNFSAASCSHIKETFDAMFPDGVPKDFSLNPKKMQYLITDALEPYFYEMLKEDIGTSFYTICFDETSNVKDKKELQVVIRYWSENKGEVTTRHLQTYFIGRADAKTIYEKVNSAIKNANLSLQRLLMIGSDGPNVNKKVHLLFNENLLEIRSVGLTDIGTCPIHIVHNSYLKSLQIFGEGASDLAVSIFHYFDGWPGRWEDFEKIQEELNLPHHKFVKHSPSRWLTFRDAALRLIEQWEGIKVYFLKFIPLKDSKTMQSLSYKRVVNLLRQETIRAEVYFVMSSAQLFTKFTETFQNDKPLIHVLYLKLKELAETLARRVCKNVENKFIEGNKCEELFGVGNVMANKDIVVCENVKKEMALLPEKISSSFMRNVKEHYIAGCSYLIKKSFCNCLLTKSLKFLNPLFIKSTTSCRDVVNVARKLPISVKEDILLDEFKMLQMEVEVSDQEDRIDHFWNKILSKENGLGQKKYEELAKVIKSSLALSHGNANVERRFSTSRWVLSEEKASTSERTLNAILTVKDSLKTYNNKPELVPMSKKLISMGQNAHKHYVMFMEEEKRLQELAIKQKEEEIQLAAETKEKLEKAEANKAKISEMENKISKSKEEHKIASEASHRLFEEANERLKKALKKGDLREVSVAQGMLEGILSMRKSEDKKLKEVESLQKKVEKRKNNIITTFFEKKPKTN